MFGRIYPACPRQRTAYRKPPPPPPADSPSRSFPVSCVKTMTLMLPLHILDIPPALGVLRLWRRAMQAGGPYAGVHPA